MIGGAAQQVTGFLKGSVKAASDLGESMNAVNKVFGQSSAVILDFGKTAATQVGLSQRAFNELATPLGAMLKNSGIKDFADQTVELTKRASDMASVFNVDVSEALQAITAGLRGEADPLEKFGVKLNAAAIEAKALEMGLVPVVTSTLAIKEAQIDAEKAQVKYNEAVKDHGKKSLEARDALIDVQKAQEDLKETMAGSTGELTDAAKAQAALALIMQQTNDVAGDFVQTSDQLANSQRIQKARQEELQAQIGEKLLPLQLKWTELQMKGAEVLANDVVPAIESWVKYMQFAVTEGDSMNDFLEQLPESLRGYAKAMADVSIFVKEHWSEISKAVEVAGDIQEYVINQKLIAPLKMLVTIIGGIVAEVKALDIPKALSGIGEDTVQGFIDGLVKKAKELPGVIKNEIYDKIPGPLRKLLESNSPSKVTYRIGEDVSEGLAKGIVGGADKYLTPEMDRLAKQIAESYGQLAHVASSAWNSQLGQGWLDMPMLGGGDDARARAIAATYARPGFAESQAWDPVKGRGWLNTPPRQRGLTGYASGTEYVPQDGPAFLHKGEAVIPAAENRAGARGTIQIGPFYVSGSILSENDLLRVIRDAIANGRFPEFGFQS